MKVILAVDDDRMSLMLVKRKLEESGFEVMTAGNGEEALAQLKVKKPDMILLDVEMPVMNGYAFMIERNKDPELKSIPVVVLTSHEENEPLFKRHGIRGYLIKPLNMQLLLAKVAELIGPTA